MLIIKKKYVDRAAIRRGIYPDNSPIRKDWEDDSYDTSRKGYKVFRLKLDLIIKGISFFKRWAGRKGHGLGRDGTGILDPVQLVTIMEQQDLVPALGKIPRMFLKHCKKQLGGMRSYIN
jgi:hypothetical protein